MLNNKGQELNVEKFVKSINSMQPYCESLAHSLKPIFEIQDELQKTLVHLLKPVFEFQNDLQKKFGSVFTPAFIQSLSELPKRMQIAIIVLGNEGWFFDPNMTLAELHDFQLRIESGKVNEVNSDLIDYYQSSINRIEDNILTLFPSRSPVLTSAFKAHRNGEYNLSVPIFLVQADGICRELIGYHFFKRKNRKPSTTVYAEQFADETSIAAFLTPLSQLLPISASVYEHKEEYEQMNRHLILHGESNDYGTLLNSCKAISLLNYLIEVLPNCGSVNLFNKNDTCP